MWTEDPFRRRELEALGIMAEVEGDGHRIRVTMDRTTFDAISFAGDTDNSLAYDEGRDAGKDEGWDEGWQEGWREGVEDGRKTLLKELEQLKGEA